MIQIKGITYWLNPGVTSPKAVVSFTLFSFLSGSLSATQPLVALKTNGVKVPLSICYLHVFYFRLLSFFIDDKVIANDLLKNSVCYCCQNLLALKPLARVSSPLIADFGRLVISCAPTFQYRGGSTRTPCDISLIRFARRSRRFL